MVLYSVYTRQYRINMGSVESRPNCPNSEPRIFRLVREHLNGDVAITGSTSPVTLPLNVRVSAEFWRTGINDLRDMIEVFNSHGKGDTNLLLSAHREGLIGQTALDAIATEWR